jgi:hypothetical protein
MRLTRLLPAAALVCGAICFAASPPKTSSASGAPPAADTPIARALATIRTSDLMATVRWLASDELEGRLAGSRGYDVAAHGMAERFRALGLEPAGDDGYFQHLTVEYNEIVGPCRLRLLLPDGRERICHLGSDFVCRGFTGSGSLTAPVVFCGYGLSAPERGYDDYAGVDLDGKIAFVIKQPPPWEPDDEDWGSLPMPRAKAQQAIEHGAVALLLASRPGDEKVQRLIGSVYHGEGEQETSFPQLHISQEVAADLLAETGRTLLELQEEIDAAKAPRSCAVSTRAQLEIHADYSRERGTANVLGVLRGSDPALAAECVVLGAHLDHVGTQGGEILFPGANDNASGAAAVLEVAEALVSAGVRPKRSVVFALFAAEEQGLFGARHYVANPPWPLEKTVAMLNLDCVGCGDSLKAGGGKSSPRLWETARRLDAESAALLVESTWSGGGADATPFHDAGVPTLFFMTTNGYEHLHLPTDTPETLNEALFTEMTRLVCRTAFEIAQDGYEREEVIPAEE